MYSKGLIVILINSCVDGIYILICRNIKTFAYGAPVLNFVWIFFTAMCGSVSPFVINMGAIKRPLTPESRASEFIINAKCLVCSKNLWNRSNKTTT